MSGTRPTYVSPVDFRIGQTPPDDVPAEYRAAFSQLYSSIQQIIFALVNQAGIGARNYNEWLDLAGTPGTLLSGNLNRLYVTASEAIVFGAAINLYDVAGTLTARNANATNNTKPCRGFCTTPGGIANGAVGEVQVSSGLGAITGLTPGVSYYLSTTNGLISATPATAAGNIEQYVGFGITSEALAFNTGYWIQH